MRNQLHSFRVGSMSALGASVLVSIVCSTPGVPQSPQQSAVAAYEAQTRKDQREHPTLALGAAAPDFSLPGVDGKTHTLQDYKSSPILAVAVAVKAITLADLQALRKNATDKTLMVNFWATWCAPCQTEYPQLLETYLWYRSRDFVSVSVDAPEDRPKVERFLNRTHSAINNRQVETDDVYAAMKSFDPAWESGVPFTMVIAPGGRVIYSHPGEVDKLELRRAILQNLPDAGMFAGNRSYWRQ